MKTTNISNTASFISQTTVKKPLSTELKDYLENYSRDNFTHDQKEQDKSKDTTKLLDHQGFFKFTSSSSEYVSTIFENNQELIDSINDKLSNYTTEHIQKEFTKLIDEDKIIFGLHNEDSYGYLSSNSGDVKNSEIFISTDQSLLGVVTTLVHEITHYQDLNQKASQHTQNTNSFELEVNAFAKEYEFLKNNGYIEEESYDSLSNLEKEIYTTAYKLNQSNSNNHVIKNHMMDLLQRLGYEKGELLENRVISNKDTELSKQIFSTNQLNSIYLKNKFEV